MRFRSDSEDDADLIDQTLHLVFKEDIWIATGIRFVEGYHSGVRGLIQEQFYISNMAKVNLFKFVTRIQPGFSRFTSGKRSNWPSLPFSPKSPEEWAEVGQEGYRLMQLNLYVSARERSGYTYNRSAIGGNDLTCLYFFQSIKIFLGGAKPRMQRWSSCKLVSGELVWGNISTWGDEHRH